MPAIIPVPAFRDNYIWVLRHGSRAVVVDPGDAAPVLAHLDAERLALDAVLVTHHHADHAGGVAALVDRFPVPVLGPSGETIPCRTRALGDGESVRLPAVAASLSVLTVPGHTRGHIAYAGTVGDESVVFCGDTLFAGGCGRLFEGTPAQMHASLARLAALPGDTLVHCAHEYTLANLRFALAVEPGNPALHARIARDRARRDRGEPTLPSRLDEELATNPFLRAGVPEVRDAAARRAGRALRDDVEVFAELRAWKDVFS
ncbi:MAG: hydroxyacylglutathione hydrolase [Betaproteobacteria bacterium]|nr:MAG: hydroxyacylglutathione hydrolase [Betaproteobacteria bacterium]